MERRWLAAHGGRGNLAQHQVEESNLPSQPFPAKPDRDDFDGQTLDNAFYAPRIRFQRFTSLERKAGYLALRGQESLSSLNKVSLLAKKLTSVYATITTKMDFSPEIYQHSAGLALYYDNMNYLFLHKTRDEASGAAQLAIIYMDNGERHDDPQKICLTEGKSIWRWRLMAGRYSARGPWMAKNTSTSARSTTPRFFR